MRGVHAVVVEAGMSPRVHVPEGDTTIALADPIANHNERCFIACSSKEAELTSASTAFGRHSRAIVGTYSLPASQNGPETFLPADNVGFLAVGSSALLADRLACRR